VCLSEFSGLDVMLVFVIIVVLVCARVWICPLGMVLELGWSRLLLVRVRSMLLFGLFHVADGYSIRTVFDGVYIVYEIIDIRVLARWAC